MRGKQAAAQTSTRRGAIGYHSAVSTAPVSRLGEGKVSKDGQWRETGRKKKETGGKDVCMYSICVEAGWRNVKVHWVQINV